MYVCTCVCMYVCVYVCMYICVYFSRKLLRFRIEVRPSFSVRKRKFFFYFFVRPYWQRTYSHSPVQPYLHTTREMTLWPSRSSPASPIRDSYCFRHKNRTVASFTDGIPNFALANLCSHLWLQPGATFAAAFACCIAIENVIKSETVRTS